MPLENQLLHQWAASLPSLADAEESQREWSPESLMLMHNTLQKGVLDDRPLLVLTRAKAGYDENFDVSAATLHAERLAGQMLLTELSANSAQRILKSGHSMHREAPDAVASAVREVVRAVRSHSRLVPNRPPMSRRLPAHGARIALAFLLRSPYAFLVSSYLQMSTRACLCCPMCTCVPSGAESVKS